MPDAAPNSPDLTLGVAQGELADGAMLLGHVGQEAVLLTRIGNEFFAVGAHCTHYHGPLIEGIVTDRTIRCPWHHACFDLRTSEALRAPAFDPLSCWVVEVRENRMFVASKKVKPKTPNVGKAAADVVERIVIDGGGAAGFAAAARCDRITSLKRATNRERDSQREEPPFSTGRDSCASQRANRTSREKPRFYTYGI